MGNVLVNDEYLEDIADAIRAKNGESTLYKPSQMAGKIKGIETYPDDPVSSLPSGYEYVPYIYIPEKIAHTAEGPGYQCAFDTTIVPTDDTSVYLEYVPLNKNSAYYASTTDFLLGCRISYEDNAFNIAYLRANGPGVFRFDFADEHITIDAGEQSLYRITMSSTTASINGVSLSFPSNKHISTTLPIFIDNIRGQLSDTPSNSRFIYNKSASGAYGRLIISEGDNVVADFVPCRRINDMKYGFVNIVNTSFILPRMYIVTGVSSDGSYDGSFTNPVYGMPDSIYIEPEP